MSGDVPEHTPAAFTATEPAPSSKSNAPEPANEPHPTVASTDAGPGPSATPAEPLSKKAQKRLAKAAYIAERKKERRAAEKERKKERRREFAQKRDAGELDADELERERKRRKVDGQGGAAGGPKVQFGARVVVDLGFDAKMTENVSVWFGRPVSQLAYTYSANRKAARPFSSLLFTSLDGRTKERMEGMNNSAYKRWAGAEWWEEGYERLWEGKADSEEGTAEVRVEEGGENSTEAEGLEREAKLPKQRQPSRAEKSTVVYLTADSEEELTELKEGETYIIGGIVDHNRYKNLCLNKSKEHGTRSARLPIGTYLTEMRTRKVLTVNQTFEILLKWVETRDWEQALHSVMPKRKFNTEGRRRGGGASSSKDAESVVEDEGADEEDMEGDGGGDVAVVSVAEVEGEINDGIDGAVGTTIVVKS